MSNKISVRQVRTVVLISMCMGLAFTLLQTVLDLRLERAEKHDEFSRLLIQTSQTATQAAWQLDNGLARQVVEGLVHNPAILAARIQDDFGDKLAEASRPPVSSNGLLQQLAGRLFADETHFAVDLSQNKNLMVIGQLSITVDNAVIAQNFFSRASYSMMFGLLRNLLLALVLLVFFYRYLTLPVQRLTEWVQSFREKGAADEMPYYGDDELATLASTFSELWHENQQTNKQLQSTIRELSSSENFARSLLENAGDALLICTLEGEILEINREACESLGYRQQELLGQNAARICPQYSGEALRSCFTAATQGAVTLQVYHQHKSGRVFPVEVRGQWIQPDRQPLVMLLARDITERRKAEARIHELAYFDPLTGLPNRSQLEERLDSALRNARKQGYYGALLYLDLDRFKTINDSLGHNVGDVLLQSVARRLTNNLSAGITAARLGGDEFVIVIPRLLDDEAASKQLVEQKAERIIEQLSRPYDILEHKLYCSASAGIALFPHEDDNSGDLMRRADTALYRVKAAGRNNFQFFEQEMQIAADNRLAVEKDLHQALEANQLELYYQPQVNHRGELIGAESLIRWNHPEKGLISPGVFLPIAEETGQILAIGDWVVAQALKQLRHWLDQGLPDSFQRLSINVSPQQFLQSDFVPRLAEQLEHSRIDPRYLELEVTENMLLEHIQIAEDKMQQLKALNLHLSIDDFGTGYSSLRYLKFLSVDVLKIDRSFVSNLHEDASDSAIVDTIIAMADKLGLSVIAEGVEQHEELEVLIELGCHCFQGYLFDKPLPADEFSQRLQQPLYAIETDKCSGEPELLEEISNS